MELTVKREVVVFSFLWLIFNLGILNPAWGQSDFNIIPLGVYGGGNEGNLSAYLVGESGDDVYVALDAGNLKSGIDKAVANGVFNRPAKEVLRGRIKGYFISHGHLDHVSGLIINSPDDKGPKPIYGTPFTLDILKTRYFTNTSWTNFADQGDRPRLKTYIYNPIKDGERFQFKDTNLKGQIFELSHGNPYKSSAVLVTNSAGNSILYFGDTGADRIEKSDRMENVWTVVAPLLKEGKLKGILIENSYDNTRNENQLFGHLTPNLLNEELQVLAKKAGKADLSGLKIIIIHIKPGNDRIKRIRKDWKKENPLYVKIIFPKQGEQITL